MSRRGQTAGKSTPHGPRPTAHGPRVARPGARRGYDLWSDAYDETANPVVALDERITPQFVRARPGERVLDAGCGTGRYFPLLERSGCAVVGFDFSLGMLQVARRKQPDVPLVLGDLQRLWPFGDGAFDAVVCALVGEHLDDLATVFAEMWRILRGHGQAIFSVYHPAMAAAGIEAHFQRGEVEYRLGAVRHSVEDYAAAFERAGFARVAMREFRGDERLAEQIPRAEKFIGFPMLLVFQALKGAGRGAGGCNRA